MKIQFIGAAHTVTGSCTLLEANGHRILIDCGMFQGAKRIKALNFEDFLFNPADIDLVLLTHAHVDHCGLIPKLCVCGFKGNVLATKATCELVNIMLPDSAYIQMSDTETKNRKGMRSGRDTLQPLYTIDDANAALQRLQTVPYEREIALADGIVAKYHDAGHIMGSALVELLVTENGKTTKLLFTGDIGQPKQPIIKDPTILDGADYLLIESTYGDRVHQHYDKESQLAEIINDTMDRGGNLIIPSFAVGRTQTLLYYFYKLYHAGRIDPDVPIVLDSPLAIAATKVFLQNSQNYDDETLNLLRDHKSLPQLPQLKVCQTAAESKALNSYEGSSIIVSASGMADAGRVLHHLKHNLWRPESTVLFVGYQAEGSLGRRLVDGIKRVRITGEEIAVRAQIKMLEGFSAHADCNQLVEWAGHLTSPKPAKVFIVHGEAPAQEALAEQLRENLGLESYIPFRGDVATLIGRECSIETTSLPAVSVEKDMEECLRTYDAEYRLFRRKILQTVLRRPEIMADVVKLMEKVRKYMVKLFSGFNF